MNKKLTSKTQYLNPELPENAAGFAKAIFIEPENDDTVLKRGTIYSVFNVRGGAGYDTNLISKVVHDILHDSYFQSDNISPIQSLEKAISDVKEKIIHLTNESIHADEAPAEFSIIAGVLWGNVMYVVQFGSAQSYLVREGEIKPINTISEGSFSAASGVVKGDDVVIFCSQEFGKKYPPNKLLSMAIGEQELLAEEACLLVKFVVDTSFTASETIDFGIPEVSKSKSSKFTRSFAKVFQNIGLHLKVAGSKIFTKKAKPIKPVETIGYSVGTGIKLKKPTKLSLATLTKPGVLIVLVLIALAISIFLTTRNRTHKPAQVTNQQAQEPPKPLVQGAETTAPQPDDEVFYDIKITDPSANPTRLAVFKNTVVVADVTSGKIYLSDQTTAKFDPETSTYTNIQNLVNIKNKLGFTDNEGYKVYDITTNKIVENYKQTGLGVTSAYLNYVYAINGTQLNRYSKNDDNTLKASLWEQSNDFDGAKSMAIAYSIFVLTKDGKLESFSTGTKDNFVIKGDKLTLKNPTQVFADIDLKYIYVADSGNDRVVSYDAKGNFVKAYTPKNVGAWNTMSSIGVTPDEKTLFVLAGSKVYKIAL